jgi:hypothetical protein
MICAHSSTSGLKEQSLFSPAPRVQKGDNPVKNIRTFALLLVVGLTIVACDDNPVADDRDTVFRFYLTPTVVNLTVGAAGEKKVTGYTLNRYGEPTFDNVTTSTCNGNVVTRPDTTLLFIEPPTRVIARGVTAGSSCIIFAAGGFSDTVVVVVQ